MEHPREPEPADGVSERLVQASRWCNCGHPPPLLIRDQRVLPGALEREAQTPMGPPSHLAPGPRTVHEERLRPGDRVLLHTDGVSEARMRDGTLFGMGRFTDAIIRATGWRRRSCAG
ncbi:Stage II sporulation protein E (SpoIIE) [Actinacidiphila paucisporea]|uniref:Stage II sporulation protein E (SpoIIE) n=1 Tax=Actinacidiphila paucisporea TaxID=310782 RepID=A0A1M7NPK6_9ACTN|nr:SpoIIE family protein phosphatase [Actinacidiphila paucisporea]SHN05913.1 Stage II sporulation protein E (SpoIIE) [Actinacidiphila paucisporea]